MSQRTILLIVILFVFVFTNTDAQWVIYDCSTLPKNTTTGGVVWVVNDSGVLDLFTVVDDPEISGNKCIRIEEFAGASKQSFSNDWAISDPAVGITCVFRTKASDGILPIQAIGDGNTYRYAYVSTRNGKFREEFTIEYPDTIDLAYAGGGIRIHFPNAAAWHIYRLTMKGDEVKLYADEKPTPIAEGITAKTTSNNYIKIGKTTTAKSIYGGLFDWVIWDLSGAYAPGKGTALPKTLTGLTTSVKEITSDIPNGFNLYQNYPNPFNPTTTIDFSIVQSSKVVLKIYDSKGCEVETLVNREMSPGNYSATWNAYGFATGVYFYRMTANGKSAMNKIVLLK
jgi:hypothetical protein